MPNNPVQIVLNDDAFLRAPDPNRGGPDKDFFNGNDDEFQRHKETILKSLDEIDAHLAIAAEGPLTYVRVRMRIEAIAKSYRPSRALFTSDLFPCVGASAPGELFYRLPRIHLRRLRARMDEAELRSTVRRPREGKPYVYVSRNRSELGAIETLEIAQPNLKRTFSTADAVRTLLDPTAASGYVIELFEQTPLQVPDDDIIGFNRSFETLQERLRYTGGGLYAALLPSRGGVQAIELLLTKSPEATLIEDRRVVRADSSPLSFEAPLEDNIDRHEKILTALAQHPLVRRIHPPIMLAHSEATESSSSKPFSIPSRLTTGTYPKIGVVDTGVAPCLSSWILHRHDFLSEHEVDSVHGTLVSGVLIAARTANGPEIGREQDGCDIVDIPLLSTRPFFDVYGRRGFEAFLEELEAAIQEARNQYGVRVFNMSLNLRAPVEQDLYSIYAARMDAIQDRLGVVIVNSAGNLDGIDWRQPWPSKPRQVLASFAARTSPDTISMPCESVRTLSVGALNPPGCSQTSGVPTTYTRRGPGLRVGVKPDLAHFGGAGDSKPHLSGLISCTRGGESSNVCGTSFAAPLIAKTIAALDIQTGERLEPRTLRAFMIHNAKIPVPLETRSLKEIARQFVGFGQPSDASAMLETNDHSITLVFESRLTVGERRPAILRFPFTWPASLVDPTTRACRGRVRMTLVYDPPIDPAFGTEFARVNLDAMLRQRQPINRKDGSPSWHGQIQQVFLPRSAGLTPPERALIEHGLKWWPTKRYEDEFGEGVGESTEWRLDVESIVRAEAQFPAEGVPFSLIVTIEDSEQLQPIFQEIRRQLVTNRVEMHDIRTAVRLRPRGRS